MNVLKLMASRPHVDLFCIIMNSFRATRRVISHVPSSSHPSIPSLCSMILWLHNNKEKKQVSASLSISGVHNRTQHACRVMNTFQLPSGPVTQEHVGTMTLGLRRKLSSSTQLSFFLKMLLLHGDASTRQHKCS